MRIHAGSILMLILTLTFSTHAQESPKIHLTAVSPMGRWTDEQSTVVEALKNAFEAKKAVLTTSVPQWTVVVDAITLESDKYVVSYVLLRGLPESFVDLAKKNEAFYSNVSEEKRATFSKEGKFVREMMSEEFIREFGMPLDSHISIIKRNELKIYAGKFADDFFARYINKK